MGNIAKLFGLELRRLLCMRSTVILYFAIFIIFSVATTVSVIGYVMVIYVVVYMLVGSDERFTAILPVTRRQTVQARYLFCAGFLVAADLVSLAINTVASPLVSPLIPVTINALDRASLFAIQFAGGALIVAAILALNVCVGTIAARYWAMGIYMVVFFGAFNFISWNSQNPSVMNISAGMIALLYLLGFAALAVSYLIAVYAFQRRQITA